MAKVVLVGEKEVGKSRLAYVLAGKELEGAYIPTIGVDIQRVKYRSPLGLLYYVQVWDTAGDIRFRTLTSSYTKGALAQIYVFDKSNLSSFHSIPTLLTTADSTHSHLLILYGNTSNPPSAVTYESAARLASSLGMVYIEKSVSDYSQKEDILGLIAAFRENYWS